MQLVVTFKLACELISGASVEQRLWYAAAILTADLQAQAAFTFIPAIQQGPLQVFNSMNKCSDATQPQTLTLLHVGCTHAQKVYLKYIMHL